MKGLVKCTLLRDLGKSKKRGDVVVYDAFKASAWEKLGILKIGEHTIAQPAEVVFTADAEEKPRRSRKKKEEEEDSREESE